MTMLSRSRPNFSLVSASHDTDLSCKTSLPQLHCLHHIHGQSP